MKDVEHELGTGSPGTVDREGSWGLTSTDDVEQLQSGVLRSFRRFVSAPEGEYPEDVD